jgi:hypothetical protein
VIAPPKGFPEQSQALLAGERRGSRENTSYFIKIQSLFPPFAPVKKRRTKQFLQEIAEVTEKTPEIPR